MRLSALLAGLDPLSVQGPSDPDIVEVTRDSRRAGPGVVFVAIQGGRWDGHDLATQVQAGVVVVERPVSVGPGVVRVLVHDTRRALGWLAAAFHGHPSRDLPVVGITGTNGKTTTSVLGAAALGPAGGRIGTLGAAWGHKGLDVGLTTPEAPELQATLAEMRQDGVRAVFMEVSSIALVQGRVEGIRFHTAVFTNLTQDHLDFHGTMASYTRAKAMLFAEERLRPPGGAPRAVVYGADPAIPALGVPADRWTFGFSPTDDVAILRVVDHTSGNGSGSPGQALWVRTPDGGHVEVHSALIGRYNALNLTGTLAALVTVGLGWDEAADRLARAGSVPGRLEPVYVAGRPLFLVDYAHTPDALENVLRTVRPTVRGRLWVVFGCGGDRDALKRPQMGAIAQALADEVVLTSDNPRSEDPAMILRDIEAGLEAGRPARVRTLVDRDAAIRLAAREAAPLDVVVLAGKGHETYQEIKGIKYPFDDRAAARTALEAP